uniref:Solute carrier family 46 member 2 n=1 Tax=Latimeria chalumnae TaxID=7897 RepID=H3B4U3_LATCH
RGWIEPLVACAQLGSSFYDTGLLIVVRDYYNATLAPAPGNGSGHEDALQRAISNFNMVYSLVLGLSPLLPAFLLARLGDSRHRKIPLCVPLAGYIACRALLLLVILLQWPVEVMFGAAALYGLTGGFSAYWAGVMAWAALASSSKGRSVRLITVELTYGLAGFVGSMASGHIFRFEISHHGGSVLAACSLALYVLCALYSVFVLKVPEEKREVPGPQLSPDACQGTAEGSSSENSRLLPRGKVRSAWSGGQATANPSVPIDLHTVVLLFAGAGLYELSVAGGVDVLSVFVLKKPLGWGAVEVGYGNAAGSMIFITSFLGVFFFSKYMKDTTMIMIGILSFSAGILVMAFVRWTFMFYIARAIMMFALIPLPTIRSIISKQVQGSSYGKVFVLLQIALSLTGVCASLIFNKIYQATLDWFIGFCFILSCIIGLLSMIPIGDSRVIYKQYPNTHTPHCMLVVR